MGKRFTSLCVAFMLIFTVNTHAEEFSLLYFGGYAKVIDIIDGDSLKVKMVSTGEVALVRIAGIDAVGMDDALKYLYNTVLGKTVSLTFDPYSVDHINGRWNNMEVKYNGESLSSKLVSLGFAKVLESYTGSNRGSLLYDEQGAKNVKQGLWDDTVKYDNYYPKASGIFYSGDGLNINTASAAKISEFMPDLPQNVVSAIISYRAVNPFNEVYDVKFIPGFTKALFDKYRSLMTVSTNITTATENELLTLGFISSAEVKKIISYRERNTFKSIDDLNEYALISGNLYNQVKSFIAMSSVTKINVSVPNVTVNINEATAEELISAGLTSSQADRIIASRVGYSYKTLGELTRLSGSGFTDFDIYKLADNLTLGNNGDHININLAGTDELISLGLTQADASRIYALRGRMYQAANIPVDISVIEGRISLYTNINKASSAELTGLGIAPAMVEAIIKYRYDQPFGSLDELQSLFEETYYSDAYNGYNEIRAFIVLR